MDFHELERLLDEIIGPMHNRHLNETSRVRDAEPFGRECGAARRPDHCRFRRHIIAQRRGLGNRREFGGLSAVKSMGISIDAAL